MDKNVPDLVEQLHREAVQRHRQQKDNGRALVETTFRESQKQHRQEVMA